MAIYRVLRDYFAALGFITLLGLIYLDVRPGGGDSTFWSGWLLLPPVAWMSLMDFLRSRRNAGREI